MSEKTMEQFLFEYDDKAARTPDMTPTDDQSYGSSHSSGESFNSMKQDLGSRERMFAILSGEEKFEYDILDNPKMVRALVDSVKQMIKNKDKIKLENKSVNERIKELKAIPYKTSQEKDELRQLSQKNNAYQLQKTLMRFESKLDTLDDILGRIEDGVEITDKTIKKYEDIVGEIEDAIFQETYVRKNLPYEKGEASATMKKPTATENFPIMFRADSGKVYYGIVRPPSGIITWEGAEARTVWNSDPDINEVYSRKGTTPESKLKIRISKDDFKVLRKEKLNNELFDIRTENGKNKVLVNDSDDAKEAIRNYILSGGERDVSDYSVMDGENKNKTKTVNPGLDKQGRPKDLTSVIDSIEFWRFVRGLF